MSVHVMSWVLRNSEETLGRRLVLLVLADHARDDGSYAWPSVETIARNARMTRRPVQEALRRLEESGAIVATGRSRTGTTIYSVVMGGAESAPGGAEHDAEGARNTTSGGAAGSARPVSKATVRRATVSKEGAPELPGTVNHKRTTEDEREKAHAILGLWNAATGQRLTSPDWRATIIMRIREHPELSVEEHGEVIRRALARPWWKGDTNPAVVYGNGRVFEVAMQAPAAAPAQQAHDIAQAEIDRLRRAS